MSLATSASANCIGSSPIGSPLACSERSNLLHAILVAAFAQSSWSDPVTYFIDDIDMSGFSKPVWPYYIRHGDANFMGSLQDSLDGRFRYPGYYTLPFTDPMATPGAISFPYNPRAIRVGRWDDEPRHSAYTCKVRIWGPAWGTVCDYGANVLAGDWPWDSPTDAQMAAMSPIYSGFTIIPDGGYIDLLPMHRPPSEASPAHISVAIFWPGKRLGDFGWYGGEGFGLTGDTEPLTGG
jgi:hypothetical protein